MLIKWPFVCVKRNFMTNFLLIMKPSLQLNVSYKMDCLLIVKKNFYKMSLQSFHRVIEKFYCACDDMAPSPSLIYDTIQTSLLINPYVFHFVFHIQKAEWTFVQFQVQFIWEQVSREKKHTQLVNFNQRMPYQQTNL